jgi:hypothetical protein
MKPSDTPKVEFGEREARRLGELLARPEVENLATTHYQFEPMKRLAAALAAGYSICVIPEKTK